jgi:hypothetical protein
MKRYDFASATASIADVKCRGLFPAVPCRLRRHVRSRLSGRSRATTSTAFGRSLPDSRLLRPPKAARRTRQLEQIKGLSEGNPLGSRAPAGTSVDSTVGNSNDQASPIFDQFDQPTRDQTGDGVAHDFGTSFPGPPSPHAQANPLLGLSDHGSLRWSNWPRVPTRRLLESGLLMALRRGLMGSCCTTWVALSGSVLPTTHRRLPDPVPYQLSNSSF